MSFHNPEAFWLLFLLIIPIIIHLFNFRRAKVVYFSNVSFLASTKSTSSNKSTIKKYLVLVARLLALAALVIAFAQPFLLDESKNDLAAKKVLYLDNSMSMGRLNLEGVDMLSAGIEVVNVINSDNQGGLMLITNDPGGSKRWLAQKEIEETLSEVRLEPIVSDIKTQVQKIDRVAGGQKNVMIISDFQESSFGQLKDLLEDSITQYTLVKVKPNEEGNLFVDTVYLENPLGFSKNGKLKFVVNNRGEAQKGVLIRVFKGVAQFASFTHDFPKDSRVSLEIELSRMEAGHSGEYRILVDDPIFPFDNETRVMIRASGLKRILQLYDNQKNRSLEAVFSNQDYFDLKVQQIGSVDQESLVSSDVIILDALRTIPKWLSEKISFNSGKVIVVPGQDLDIHSYSSVLGSGPAIKKDTSRYSVTPGSLNHPIFDGVFEGKDEQSGMPNAKLMLELNSSEDVILKSELNAPVLSRIRSNIYVFATPLTDAYTNLHRHALFVPMMYQVAMKGDAAGALAYSIDDLILPLSVDLPEEVQEISLASSGERIVPVIRNINGQDFIELPIKSSNPGFYYLISGVDTLDAFALNLSKAESILQSIADGTLQAWANEYNNVQFLEVESQEEIVADLGDLNQDTPLWKYALILVLIFLIAEQTLLRILK